MPSEGKWECNLGLTRAAATAARCCSFDGKLFLNGFSSIRRSKTEALFQVEEIDICALLFHLKRFENLRLSNVHAQKSESPTHSDMTYRRCSFFTYHKLRSKSREESRRSRSRPYLRPRPKTCLPAQLGHFGPHLRQSS